MFLGWPLLGIAGLGWAWYEDQKDERNVKPIQGPLEFNDYLDRPSWFNPISGTNADSYFIGAVILVLLYNVCK